MGIDMDDIEISCTFHALEDRIIHGTVPAQDYRHGPLALDDPDRFPEIGHGPGQVSRDIIRIPAVHDLPFIRIHIEFFPLGIIGPAFFVSEPGGPQPDAPGSQPAARPPLDGQVKRGSQNGNVRIQVIDIRRQIGFGESGNARGGHIQRFLQTEVIHTVLLFLFPVMDAFLRLGPL